MTKESLAELLNGREYRNEISNEEEKIAELNDLVVVFGASDDLLEFRGVVDDEIGCFDGGNAYLVKKKKGWTVMDESDYDEKKEQMEEFDSHFIGHEIEAVWSPDEPECSWLIKTEIPHATFDIMEDGELYCRGVVLSVKDLN